ncbi:unnamed protein product, partial [Mesorhabditis belari]|uniref:Uncharacterized protein n=1 Tax=Mesorhabditis belari TaxID=2138241 RepID=A0AAF3J368_9BILA
MPQLPVQRCPFPLETISPSVSLPMRLPTIILLLFHEIYSLSRCYSCLTHCRILPGGKIDAKTCDCVGKAEDSCMGNACFAKIELFSEEKTAIIQKGCTTELQGGQVGCQYASNSETVHCFCQGELCNNRNQFADFVPARLPTVECCGCSEKHGDSCPKTGCLHKCKGNYCVVDFDGIEQGCGLGFPRLQNFLRMPAYLDWQGEPICARYEAGPSTVMNGCTCTGLAGNCNELNKTRNYQLSKVIDRPEAPLNYCYSVSHKSGKPFGPEVFKKSVTCEGQYCFISMTTSEIVLETADFEHSYDDHEEFVGLARPKFELLAGCLKVDDPKKLVVGCTTEYSHNLTDPLSKHCILGLKIQDREFRTRIWRGTVTQKRLQSRKTKSPFYLQQRNQQ